MKTQIHPKPAPAGIHRRASVAASAVLLGALLAPALLLTACGGGDEDDDDTEAEEGACGDAVEHDVEIRALVLDAETGLGVEGIEVSLEDQAWNPGELGASITDADGASVFTAAGVTDLPGCWGTALSYVMVVHDPMGVYADVEDDMNTWLYNAIFDESFVAEPLPIELELAR